MNNLLQIFKKNYLVILFTIILGGVSLFQITQRNIPVAYNDEFGYWATAAYINGMDWSSVISTIPYYSFGYGLILSLVLFITKSTIIAYKVSLLLNSLWIILSFFCLINISITIANYMEIKRNNNILYLISFVVCCYVGILEGINYTWPEVFLFFLFCLIVFLVIKIINNGRNFYFFASGVICAYSYYVHQRTLGIVLAFFLVIIGLRAKNKIKTYSLLTFALTAVVLFTALSYFKSILIDAVWDNPNIVAINNMTGQFEKISYLFSWSGLKAFFMNLSGKVYYIFGASLFVVPYALLCMIKSIKNKYCICEYKFICFFIATSFSFSLFINTLFMIVPVTITHVVYGRYIDNLFGPLLIIGILNIFKSKISFKDWIILVMIFLISCISVSILCNKSQIHGLTAINNAGISIFVERKWIALSKSIIFYICIFTILTVLSRICSNKKALVLLFVLLGYWVINAVDVYRKYDSLWLEISQESIDIYEKLEDYNHKNSKVYGYTPKSDIYLSQYPVNGVQFLADYPIQVITKWQDLQDLPENSLIVTIQDKMLDESTKYRNLFNNDKFYVYEKVG